MVTEGQFRWICYCRYKIRQEFSQGLRLRVCVCVCEIEGIIRNQIYWKTLLVMNVIKLVRNCRASMLVNLKGEE